MAYPVEAYGVGVMAKTCDKRFDFISNSPLTLLELEFCVCAGVLQSLRSLSLLGFNIEGPKLITLYLRGDGEVQNEA